jgi:hypothetical protein
MHPRDRARKRNRNLGAGLMAICMLGIGFAFFPTAYATDIFPVSPGVLPQEYQIEVRHPSFGQMDSMAEVTVRLRPRETPAASSTPADAYVAVIAEPQSADVVFDPAGRIQTPLVSGRQVSFSWKSAGMQTGARSFSIFLFLPEDPQAQTTSGLQPFWAHTFTWQTFAGYGSWKIPILFAATLGFLFGFGMILGNTIR